jgi:uncharacterized protein YbbC (DUF1343 family)
MVTTGLERLISEPERLRDAGRLGLLYNQASVDRRFRDAPTLVNAALPGRLTTLFGPQHGVSGTEQDNMHETPHSEHSRLGLPIYSLYADRREPTPDMLKETDTVLIDLQDVGTRVYTFIWSAILFLEACARLGKAVVILDRPNPINGVTIEGNLLKPEYASFVGLYPIPMRHGMTIGELALLLNEIHGIGCDLTVIPMTGWNRADYFDDTDLPWVIPSPNMPVVETAVVYPGQVIFEGTNVSEGRGTTRPFEIFGAPYINPAELLTAIDRRAFSGAVLREVEFRPTFNKWVGSVCHGFQIHVVDRTEFSPYCATLAIVSALVRVYPGSFRWVDPPYEYVHDRLPIDIILGDHAVREQLEAGAAVPDVQEQWTGALREFKRQRSDFLLY